MSMKKPALSITLPRGEARYLVGVARSLGLEVVK